MEKWFNTSLTITKIRAKFNPSPPPSPAEREN